jgi:hypothetical protein
MCFDLSRERKQRMETVVVIVVLLVLLVLFGGAGYFFVRETGWEHARLWFTAPRQFRHIAGSTRGNEPARDDLESDSTRLTGTRRAMRFGEPGPMTVALDDNSLRELREELHGELTRAAGLTREFDARLTRMEETLSATRQLPDEIGHSIKEQESRTRRRIEKLRIEINATRVSGSPFGQRRSDALADLYGHLARIEAALAGVVNPMLLPGEPLRVPDEFYSDTLVWSNWNDVGERAYAFGEVFNQNRFVLEPDIADRIERFIGTFRQALTGTVYPVLHSDTRTPAQIAQMRSGLDSIVTTLPPLRRELEAAYRANTAPVADEHDDEDED